MKTWAERIAEAEQRGRFTPEDHINSGPWSTCAVSEYRGQFDAWHNDNGQAEPRDPVLVNLGRQFPMAVGRNNIAEAKHIHAEIAAYFATKLIVGEDVPDFTKVEAPALVEVA